MSKVSFSTLAYCKMVAHAAKYPHCEVNGLLVAENSTKGDKLVIVDTVPLFHQCLHVSPMSEIALMQIDQSASTCDMYIAGYYLANETLDDLRYLDVFFNFSIFVLYIYYVMNCVQTYSVSKFFIYIPTMLTLMHFMKYILLSVGRSGDQYFLQLLGTRRKVNLP